MPVAVSYPGVYVEEIPSGVRTITGVATSITAFVGWAPKGPTKRAELVLSWADFERKFGGLDNRSYLGYSVYHFFNNGGSRAYIIRLVAVGSENEEKPNAANASVTIGNLKISAGNPGDWANTYAITTQKRADDAKRFRLVVHRITVKSAEDPEDPDKKNVEQVQVEVFENLSMDKNDSRFVGKVLENDSNLVTGSIVPDEDDPNKIPDAPTDSKIPTSIKNTNEINTLLQGGNDGVVIEPNDPDIEEGDPSFETALVNTETGVPLLDRISLFNILCVPGETKETTIQELEKFCRQRRAFLIADSEKEDDFGDLLKGPGKITGDDSINAAFYFPWILAPDALQENRPKEFPPCGFVAGIYARTDATRGVWKAPAGTEASLTGANGVTINLTDNENGVLNPLAINCIRTFPVYGTIIWGARTLQGNDERGSEWKYIPVRRTALFIEESLFRALKWVVFEPNDEPLWAQIRLNVGAFMHNLFRQGAFQGTTPKDAYFVKCDKETTTQNDIDRGIVNIVVGFAPLKPAEFVIIKLQQMAGQIEV